MKDSIKVMERNPLLWPSDVPRTRPQDREDRRAWKKTDRQFLELLAKELDLFGCFGIVVTRKDPSERISAPDPSVAVWFSRRSKDDFRWQDALGITNPDPSIEEVNRVFRELARKYHPDLRREDAERMVELNIHHDNAIRFIKQTKGEQSQFCIGCDKFTELRWNVNAVRNTIHSFRQMERDGTSRIVERAMGGFAAQLTQGVPDVVKAVAS